ncbi:hypothetical protein [Lentzea albidocapillata]|uniref:hypothetical protein n=1 Tax=Lentzea albidocapillata TaxID=40571 RepID=UPI000B7ED875|nr:hypothetical protein [Lentzea albidocapillata]
MLLATGVPALARDEKIDIVGRVYLDRNGNNAYDVGDGVQTWGTGVRVTDQVGGRTFTVVLGADGRYRAGKIPKSTYLVENLGVTNYTSTTSPRRRTSPSRGRSRRSRTPTWSARRSPRRCS